MRAESPAPDGCYPLYTTAEGCSALNFLTTGVGAGALVLNSDCNGHCDRDSNGNADAHAYTHANCKASSDSAASPNSAAALRPAHEEGL